MARTRNQRTRLLRIKEIFERKTDSEHGITINKLLSHLSAYGIDCERKAIYQDIVTLRDEVGMDISLPERGVNEYKLLSRDFDVGELKLIIDSLQSSKYLSENDSRILIKKICSLCSESEQKELLNDLHLKGLVKNNGVSLSINADYVYEAIKRDKQISFLYFDNLYGKKVYRKNGSTYTRSPFELLYRDENYYMLAYDPESKTIRTYRLDRMNRITILDKEREGKDEFAKIDVAEFQKQTFNMYRNNSKKQFVTMVFDNSLSNVVIDQFSHDVQMIREDDSHFRITAKVSVNEQFFGWIFGFGEKAKIISPTSVCADMDNMLLNAHRNYDKSEVAG